MCFEHVLSSLDHLVDSVRHDTVRKSLECTAHGALSPTKGSETMCRWLSKEVSMAK